MSDPVSTLSDSEESKDDTSTVDSQSKEESGLLNLMDDITNEVFPGEEKSESKDDEKTESTEKDKEGDPVEEDNKWQERYEESQKQIGELANKVGALTTVLESQNKKPDEADPIHIALASADPSQIEEQIKLPEGVTGAQVKLFSSLIQHQFQYIMKKLDPVLNNYSNITSDQKAEVNLVEKYPDIGKYNTQIREAANKTYPSGLPEGKNKWSIIEEIYLRVSKADRLAGSKEAQQQRRREKLRKGSVKKTPSPTKTTPKADFYDKILSEVD